MRWLLFLYARLFLSQIIPFLLLSSRDRELPLYFSHIPLSRTHNGRQRTPLPWFRPLDPTAEGYVLEATNRKTGPTLTIPLPETAVVIQSDLTIVSEAKVDFDGDFGAKYGIKKGVLQNPGEGEVFAPVALWLESLDLVLQRLKEKNTPLDRIRGISGSCQQHGSVFWGREAESLLGGLKADKPLVDQLTGAFSHPYAPNWQDHSTQAECDQYDAQLETAERLAQVTGSSAHHVSTIPDMQ